MLVRNSLAMVVAVVTGLLLGCSSVAQREAAAPEQAPSAFARALEEARRDLGVRRQLIVEAEGRLTEGVTSVLLFGDGVAVLNGRRQFRVPDETVVAVLDLVKARGVASWPEESSVPEGNALEIHRRLLITIGEVSHLVVERNKRPPRPSLQELLGEIVGLVQPAAAGGVEVASLEEGLRLIAGGRLAPHVLTVTALAPSLPGAAKESPDGWQLTLQRGILQASGYSFAEGVRPISRRDVLAEVAGLAQLLLDTGAARLPRQIHVDEGHFQLNIELLGQRLSVQARRFAGKGEMQGLEAREALLAVRDQLRGTYVKEVGAAGADPGV